MSGTDWLASIDPQAMLRYLQAMKSAVGVGESPYPVPDVSDRKLRLFACACCRHPGVWERLSSGYRNLVLAAEQAIEGTTADLDRDDWEDLQVIGWNQADETMPKALQAAALRDIVGNPWKPVTLPPGPRCGFCGGIGKAASHCDACGNWGHFGCQPCAWLTPDVLSLAQAAYEERPVRKCRMCIDGEVNWGVKCDHCDGTGRIDDGTLDPVRLSILADALEEAGCPQQIAIPCSWCSRHVDNLCPRCNGLGRVYNGGTPYDSGWEVCDVCDGSKKFPPGYHPERNPGSGRHEGGYTNCKTCNGGVGDSPGPGKVWLPHPLLSHLRSPGPHYRGCWAVDLVLGKS